MKRLLCLLLAIMVLHIIIIPALAVTTTEEKSRQYKAAIEELEAYLESYGNEGNLYGIQSVFDSLGRFEQSKSLYYYTTVLIKLSEETYDFELLSTLELLDLDQRFQDYLNDALKGSPLCSVEELKNYVEGREKENDGDSEGAINSYKNCPSYFDASERYQALRGDKYQQIYDEALEKQNAGDLAGAYFLFSEIAPYDKSEEWKAAIVALLKYTPQSPTDNLLPVTDVEAISSNQTEVVLSWSASEHAKTYDVQYKQSGTDNWASLGETESTTYTVSGLAANTTYDFRIIAAIDKIKAEGVVVNVDTTTTTPTPTPEPKPMSSVERFLQAIQLSEVGDVVTLGRYEQDCNLSNGQEEIEWIIIAKDEEAVLLLSRYGLDSVSFAKESAKTVTWENSEVREWLNNDFLQSAFSTEELGMILTTHLYNSDHAQKRNEWLESRTGASYPTKAVIDENDTEDKIFVLSYADILAYLPRPQDRVTGSTDYALQQGKIKKPGVLDWYWERQRNSLEWYLRTPGNDSYDRLYIYGELVATNIARDSSEELVRPAMWVNTGNQDNSSLIWYPSIQRGAKGDEVVRLQQALIDGGWLNDKADGAYGKKTEDAVRAAQISFNMNATGVADNAFRKKLYDYINAVG